MNLEERVNKLETKMDKQGERMNSIEVYIARLDTYHENLSKIVEKQADTCAACSPIVFSLAEKDRRAFWTGVAKTIGIGGASGGAAYAAAKSAATASASGIPAILKTGSIAVLRWFV